MVDPDDDHNPCLGWGCGEWGNMSWGTTTSTLKPTFVSVSPPNGATGVPLIAPVTIVIGNNSCLGLILQSIKITIGGVLYYDGSLYVSDLDDGFTAACDPASDAEYLVLPNYDEAVIITIYPLGGWEPSTTYLIEAEAANENGTAYLKSKFTTISLFTIDDVEVISLNLLAVTFTSALSLNPNQNTALYNANNYSMLTVYNSDITPQYVKIKEILFSNEVNPRMLLLFTSPMTDGATYEVSILNILDVFGRTITNVGNGLFRARKTKTDVLKNYMNPNLNPSYYSRFMSLIAAFGIQLDKAGGAF